MNTYDSLFAIRAGCRRTVDHAEDALAGMLTTGASYLDDKEAREMLTKALGSAKTLLAHLERFYEFGNGTSEAKEASCLD